MSTKRNKKRTFGFKFKSNAKAYQKSKIRKHRNKTPEFLLNKQSKDFAHIVWFFLKRCEIHNINKNTFLNALRLAEYKREAIRSERREILIVLMLVLIVYCDFAPSSKYLFEVRASFEHISKMCNQAYEYSDESGKKRTRSDTVRNALNMLEDAELITILREYDKKGRKHKAMRIWLNVEFFIMLGINESQLRKLVVDFHKYQFINNRLGKTFKEYQKHIDKLEHKGVADINNNISLKNLLIKRRKDFLGEHIIRFVSQVKPANYLTLNIDSNVFKPCFRSFEECNTPDEVKRLRKRLADKERLRQQARIKAANDIAFRKAQEEIYLDELNRA